MSFGSNVMPKRFGAGRKKPKPQVAQLKIWEAAVERKKYEATWLKAAKKMNE